MEEAVKNLREMNESMSNVVHSIEISIATMTENLSETRRTNERLEALLADITLKEEENRKKVEDLSEVVSNFKTRVITTVSVIIAVTTLAGWIFDKCFLLNR